MTCLDNWTGPIFSKGQKMLTSIVPHLAGSEIDLAMCNCGSPGCLFKGFIIKISVAVPFLAPDSFMEAMLMINHIKTNNQLPPANIPCFGYN